jgi:hypothetical protein
MINSKLPASAVSSSGVSTIDLVAPAFRSPDQDFIYYVDPAGSDSNDGLTVGTPLLTLQAAVAKLPSSWKQKCRIVLAAGTYTIEGAYNLRIGTPIGQGEPLVIQGAMEDSGLGERTITGVTTYGAGYVVSVTDSTLTPTLDQYEGYFIRMTVCASSGCVGMRRMIRSNTIGGQFDFNVGSMSTSVKPAVGDKFVLERPASVISYNNRVNIGSPGLGTDAIANVNYAPSLITHQVKLSGVGSSAAIVVDRASIWANVTQSYMDNANTSIQLVNGSLLRSGPTGSGLLADGLTNSSTPDRYGAGLYCYNPSGGVGGIYVQASRLSGNLVGRNSKILASYTNTLLDLSFLSLNGGYVSCDQGANFRHSALPYGPQGRIINSTTYGVSFDFFAFSSHFRDLDISSCSGNGIFVGLASYLPTSEVTGSGNGGAGIQVSYGGYLYERTGMTITGTSGEVKVGGQTTTHAVIAAGTPLIVPPHGTANKYGGTTDYPLYGFLASATLDTNAIAAGTTVTQDIVCAAALTGADCVVCSPATLEAGLLQTALVSSAGHVQLRTANISTAPITPAAVQTIAVKIFNP